MATSPTPAPEAQAPINHFGRLTGALFSPGATFVDIARRPSWIAPIALLTILSLAVSVLMARKVNWERVVAKQMEQNPRTEQLQPQQRQDAIQRGAKVARSFVYVFGVLGPGIFALLVAAIYLGAFNLLAGAGLGFGTAMAAGSHALMPSAVANVLAIVILAIKDPEAIDPEHLIAANLSVAVPSDAPKWLMKLAESFDLFSLWILVLLAVGFAAANPKKISRGRAFGIVFGLWAVYVLIKVAWAAL
jgi:hypothetical protein